MKARRGICWLGVFAAIPLACANDESTSISRPAAGSGGVHVDGGAGVGGAGAFGNGGSAGFAGTLADGSSGVGAAGGVAADGSAGEATAGSGGAGGMDSSAGSAGISGGTGLDSSAGTSGLSGGAGVDSGSTGTSGGASGASVDASAGAGGASGSAGTSGGSAGIAGGGASAGGSSGGGTTGLDAGGDADAGSSGPMWVEQPVTGDPFTPRRGHSAVLGPGETTIYVFGGQGYYEVSSELFVYDWQSGVIQLSVNGGNAPAPRTNHVAVLDTVRSRLLVFGGRGYYDLYDDIYALDLAAPGGAWARLAPGGTIPKAREGHVAVFDVVRNRLVIFGGRGYHDLYADCWELAFGSGPDGTWSELSPAGQLPAPRTEAAVAYDAATSRMFVGGGHGYHDVLREIAVLDLTTAQGSWSQLSPAPAPPDNGIAGAWLWDGVAQRLFQYSGQAYYRLLNAPSTVELGAGLPGSTLAGAPGLPELLDSALVYVPSAQMAVLIAGQGYHDLSNRIFRMTF